MTEIFYLFWFFLPTIMANMAPVFAARLPMLRQWSYPLDGFAAYRGKRILGDHKTIRGVVAGTMVGIIVAVIQYAVVHNWSSFQAVLPPYDVWPNPIILGFLLGFGALAGDAIKSFFKRQLNIASGRSWFPFDQLDSVVGAMLASWLYVPLTPMQYVKVIIGGLVIHMATVSIGYFVGVRERII